MLSLQYIIELVFYVLSCILSIMDINPLKIYMNNMFTKNINITTTIIRAETQKKNLMIILTYKNVFFFFLGIVY